MAKKSAKRTPIKKSDFQVKFGTQKVELTRGVQINGKTSNLKVTLELNYKKDLIKVTPVFDNDQIVGDPEIDEATLAVSNELTIEAQKMGIEWRNKRKQAKEDNSDPDQLEIGF